MRCAIYLAVIVLLVVGCTSGHLDAQRSAPSDGAPASVQELIERARHLADTIEEAGERKIAENVVSSAQAKSGDVAGAKAGAAVIADPRHRADVFRRIADAQADGGDVEGAMETAGKIDHAAYRSFAYLSIAFTMAEAGDLSGALETLHLAKQIAAEVETEEDRAGLLGYLGGLSGTIAVLQAESSDILGAKQTASGIEELEPRLLTYRAIASAQAEAGDLAGALQTAEEIDDSHVDDEGVSARDWAFYGIALSRLKAGDVDEAKEAAAGISVNGLQGMAFSEVARVQALAGDVEGAKKTAEEITHWMWERHASRVIASPEEREPDPVENARTDLMKATFFYEDRPEVLGRYRLELVDALLEAGDVEGAKQAADEAELRGTRAAAYRSIARVQAEAGGLQDVLAWVDETDQPYLRVVVLAGAAEGLIAREESDISGDVEAPR